MKRFCYFSFFIICIGIFVSSSSIVKAYTWEDLHEFVVTNQGNSSRNTQNTTMTYFSTYWNEISQALINSNINVDNYNAFVLKANKTLNNYNFFIYLVENATSYGLWNSSSQYSFSGTSSYKYINLQNKAPSSISTSTFHVEQQGTGNVNFNSISIYDSVGLFTGASTSFLNNSSLFAQNYYNAITSNDVNITNNSTTPFDIQQGIVGLKYDINNITFKLYSQDDIYNQDCTAVYTDTNSGQSFNLLIDYLNIISTGYYKINMYNNGDLLIHSDIFKITKSRIPQPGEITNESGDVTGKVDLSGVISSLDNINNSIISGDNKIIAILESGEKKAEDRDNWWRDTYNNLFTLSSGDIVDIYNNISSSISSGDTILVAYQPIQELLEAEPSDFIIRWDSIPIALTFNNGEQLTNGNLITSGEVNFSQMARDNATLGTIKFWVNTILSFGLFYLCGFEIYRILLYLLGQSPSLVDAVSNEEEITTETIVDTSYYNHSDSVSKVVNGIRTSDSTGRNSSQTITRRRRL